MKKAFSLVMAVIFVVLIATIGMAALSLANKSVKETSDIYLREQAELLALSSAEIAIMAMQDHNYTNNCLENLTVFYPDQRDAILRADVRISYFDNALNNCNHTISAHRNIFKGVVDNIALLDISVSSTPAAGIEPVRFYKRIIQRP